MNTDDKPTPKRNLWRNLRFLFQQMQKTKPEEFRRQFNHVLSPKGHTLLDQTRDQLHRLQHTNAFTVRDSLYQVDHWFEASKDAHTGERCFLLGCGPSLKNLDTTLLAGEQIMATNGAFLLDNIKPDYYVTVSHYFYQSHLDAIRGLRCKRRFLPHYLKELESDCPTTWLNTVEASDYGQLSTEKPLRFSNEPHKQLFLGGTVIFACLQILLHLGYEEVILLGVDHSYSAAIQKKHKTEFWTDSASMQDHFTKNYYRKGTQVNIDLPAMERAYQLCHQAFENKGRRLYNATPGTRLTLIPKIDLEAAVALRSNSGL
ncbi:MAG: 6-hydroxymethylpterin diphosphokinase MptE-like protein [Opitutales bacterium]